MEPDFQLVFIVIAILIAFSIWFLIVKYFIIPLFFKPKINTDETFDFLKKEKLVFVDKRELNKYEKELNPFEYKMQFSIVRMFSVSSEYIVICFSESHNEYRFYWLKLNQWYLFYMKFLFEILTGERIEKSRKLEFKKIEDNHVLNNLKNEYRVKSVSISDNCPACQNQISIDAKECPNCGLSLAL